MKSGGNKKTNNIVSPALKQEFRNLGALIEDNNHKLGAVAEQVADVLVRTTNIEMNLDIVKSDVKNLNANMDVVKSDVDIIKSGLKRKVDLEDFEALTHRVSVLEKRVLK
ncbi:MAG: hypothetical protein Q7S57_04620 [bacterium]|nr:hypothetical protein [bacterium]